MRFIAFFLSFILAGCANLEANNFIQWTESAKKEVQAGRMKLSEFYKASFVRMEAVSDYPKKSFDLKSTNLLINAALDMEAGRITVEQFESIRRGVRAADVEYKQKAQAESDAALMRMLAAYGNALRENSRNISAQTPYMQNRSINCYSSTIGNATSTNCN